jgi:Ca2+/Na+ antiporter
MIDLRDLIAKDKLLDFWPTARQTAEERVLATTRFMLYAIVLVYIIRRDARVVALGVLVLAALYVLYGMNMIPDGKRVVTAGPKAVSGLRMPTHDNPMANFLLGDDPSFNQQAPWYPSMKKEVQQEWATIHPFERKRDAERNFYTTAASSWPNDQAAFTNAAFGKPFAPTCRDDPAACNPDGPYARGPEPIQLRGGNGR